MSDAVQSTSADAGVLRGGGPASRFHATPVHAALAFVAALPGAVLCTISGPRPLSVESFLFDRFLLVGTCLIAAGFLLVAAPYLRRARHQWSVGRTRGEPWNAPDHWSARTVLAMGRRRSSRFNALSIGALIVGIVAVTSILFVFPNLGVRSDVTTVTVVAVFVSLLLGPRWIGRLRWGDVPPVEVGYASFPCLVGDRVQVQMKFAAALPADAEPPVATLQCVRENRCPGFVGWKSELALVVPAADVWEVPEMPGTLAVEFDIPSEAHGTDLLVLPAYSWYLGVSVETPSGWHDGAVAAPVFARIVPPPLSP